MKAACATTSYPAPGPLVRPGLGSILVSLVLAAGTLSVLPLFGVLSARQHEMMSLQAAPDIVLAPKAAPPRQVAEPDKAPERPPKRRPKLRRPELARPKRSIEAMKARLSLSLGSLMEGAGDFSLDFEIGAGEVPGLVDEGPPVFELAELDSPPRSLARVRPMYPPRARQRGIEGFAELVFTVKADGSVADIKVARSEPGEVFVNAARAAARRWRFIPGRKDGSNVSARMRQLIRFRLEDR